MKNKTVMCTKTDCATLLKNSKTLKIIMASITKLIIYFKNIIYLLIVF